MTCKSAPNAKSVDLSYADATYTSRASRASCVLARSLFWAFAASFTAAATTASEVVAPFYVFMSRAADPAAGVILTQCAKPF